MPEPFKFDDSYDYPDIVAPRSDLSDEHRAAVMPDHVRELIAKRLAERERSGLASPIASLPGGDLEVPPAE